jgi:hypothetical protein
MSRTRPAGADSPPARRSPPAPRCRRPPSNTAAPAQRKCKLFKTIDASASRYFCPGGISEFEVYPLPDAPRLGDDDACCVPAFSSERFERRRSDPPRIFLGTAYG